MNARNFHVFPRAFAGGLLAISGGPTLTKRQQRWLAFVIVFTGYLAYLMTSADRVFWYDAGVYWGTVRSYSLNDYGLSYRGYSFPYICFLIRQLAAWLHLDEQIAFWTFSSLLMATLGTIIVPTLVKTTAPACKPRFWSILAFNGLVFLFFRGYANYPLTDIPALAVLLGALCLINTSADGILPGLLLGLAVNFRPVYLIAGIPCSVLLVWRARDAWRSHPKASVYAKCAGFVLGLCLVLGPQVYINHHIYQRTSLFPPADIVYGKNLYLFQLQTGFGLQKLEGNVGTIYPDSQVIFGDPTGKTIAASQKIDSYADIIRLYTKYPLEFVAIYARHLFSGLDVKFPSVYIKNPYEKNWWLALINYSIIFLFLAACRNIAQLRVDRIAFTAVVAAPVLLILAVIPTAVEVRFFMPLHLLMYAVVTLGGNEESSRWRWSISKFILFGAFLIVCCTLSDSAYACMYYPKSTP